MSGSLAPRHILIPLDGMTLLFSKIRIIHAFVHPGCLLMSMSLITRSESTVLPLALTPFALLLQ